MKENATKEKIKCPNCDEEFDYDIQIPNTQKMFSYTHGFGIVMNSINGINKDGEPEFLLSEMKPEISVGDLKITEPRIYFGLKTKANIAVNLKNVQEFDHPLFQDIYPYYN